MFSTYGTINICPGIQKSGSAHAIIILMVESSRSRLVFRWVRLMAQLMVVNSIGNTYKNGLVNVHNYLMDLLKFVRLEFR